jgi:hypothetical protein
MTSPEATHFVGPCLVTFRFQTWVRLVVFLQTNVMVKPHQLLVLSRTEGLLLHNINISGTIPPEFGDLTNLCEFLVWTVCWFRQTIFVVHLLLICCLKHCTVVALWLQGNALTGTVPPVIQDMEKLTSKFELFSWRSSSSLGLSVLLSPCSYRGIIPIQQ